MELFITLELPAGILQGIFFSPNRPKYMNYGGIGFIIGHELTHGFDDEGRQYDSNGNLLNWWKESTENQFLERAQCMINQYGNFTEPSTGLNVSTCVYNLIKMMFSALFISHPFI